MKEIHNISGGIGGVDLRNEFDALIYEFGFFVLLRRNSQKVHCRCWNEIYGSPNPDCIYCGGTGYVSKIERHKVMQALQTGNLRVQNGLLLLDNKVTFYFRYDAAPTENDDIYVVGWQDSDYTIPVDIKYVYTINVVMPYRGDRGRVEYYATQCQTKPININKIEVSVRNSKVNNKYTGQVIYDLLIGG